MVSVVVILIIVVLCIGLKEVKSIIKTNSLKKNIMNNYKFL
jgi:hypothetical protein